MIIREMKQVTVSSYNSTLDAYGQQHKSGKADRYVDMVIKIVSQSNINDPRFLDITNLGLTRDTAIKAGNEVLDGTTKYLVMYVIPTSRLTQVLLKRI